MKETVNEFLRWLNLNSVNFNDMLVHQTPGGSDDLVHINSDVS